jgi:hypothetical protein
MKQKLKQELADAFAKIHVIADTFEHPEKYTPMSESDYVNYVKEEAKRHLENEKN